MSLHPGLSYTPAGSPDRALLGRLRRYALVPCLALAGMAFLPHPAQAQAVLPFSLIGHIEKFTEDIATAGTRLGGGTMTVNGVQVVIPKNTVLVMPAAYATMGQIFDGPHPGVPWSPRESGLAMADVFHKPIVPFEATINGNIVGTPPVYVAGLVYISQQAANTADGFIKSINYATGELCVGSNPLPVFGCPAGNSRVRINDPIGRYGLANLSPDERFSADTDNPTIHAANGSPMCVPRVAPPAVDLLCPVTSRPKDLVTGNFLTQFVLTAPQAAQQVPFVLGDYITVSGTHATGGSSGNPLYVSAHTINANVAPFTPAGVIPYLYLEKTNLGAGPTLVCPGAECTNRTIDVGFTTNPAQTPNAAVYAIDVAPLTGNRTVRKLIVPSIRQAVVGRFRLNIDKAPQLLAGGGATREMLFRIEDGTLLKPLTDGAPVPTGPVTANGLIAGQYIVPTFDYLFAEGQPGAVPPSFNFQCLAFLVNGWGNGSLIIPRLDPWPGAIGQTFSCATN